MISDRHLLMVDHYFACDFNKTEAARRAGYHLPNAYIGRLFARDDVKAEIKARVEELRARAKIDQDWVIERYRRIVECSLEPFMVINEDGSLSYDFSKATPAELKQIASYGVEFTTNDDGELVTKMKVAVVSQAERRGALDGLCRVLGLNKDKLEVKGEINLVEALRAGRKRAKMEE